MTSMVAPPIRVDAKALEVLAMSMLERLGCAEDEGSEVAAHMVHADLSGDGTYGVHMLTTLAAAIQNEEVTPNLPVFVAPSASQHFLLVNGFQEEYRTKRIQYALGQRALCDTVNVAISRTKKRGVCVASLRHSVHIGRLAYYAEQVALEGLAGIFVADMGTPEHNPVCISFPSAGAGRAFVLDFAISSDAVGDIVGGLVEVEPELFLGDRREGGCEERVGLQRASEALAAALCNPGKVSKGVSKGRVESVVCFLFLPALLLTAPGTPGEDEVDSFLRFLRTVRGAHGLPGDTPRHTRALRKRLGIPFEQSIWNEIVACATSLGVHQEVILSAEESKRDARL